MGITPSIVWTLTRAEAFVLATPRADRAALNAGNLGEGPPGGNSSPVSSTVGSHPAMQPRQQQAADWLRKRQPTKETI